MTAARAVYTAIIGGYEELLEQPIAKESSVPFICFTDDPDLTSDTWEIRQTKPILFADAIRSARAIKIRGHVGLEGYDETLWIDNTVLLVRDPNELLDDWLADADLAIPIHSYRDDVETEFAVVAHYRVDEAGRVLEQLAHYKAGAPDVLAAQALWTGMLARRTSEAVRHTMERWFDQVLRYSRRDQLSVVLATSTATHTVKIVPIDNLESIWHRWPMARNRRPVPPITDASGDPLLAQTVRLRTAIDEEAIQFNEAVVDRERVIVALESVVADLLGSTSWRITRPLRAILDRVSRR